MLTAGTVSPNVIPGICKALEKFVLIYGTDEVLRAANSQLGKVIQMTGQLTMGPKRSLRIESIVSEAPPPVVVPTDPTQGQLKVIPPQEQPPTETPKQAKPEKFKPGAVKVDFPRQDTLSLEPTWVKIETTKSGVQLLGIKVIPFPIRTTQNVVQLIKDDRARKFLDAKMTSMQRTVIRILWRVARFLRLPEIKDRALTGDPKKDILFASTVYKHNVFVCFNQMDIEQENLFSEPAQVQKLQKLGWRSFVVADDVNKQVNFCMNEFRGLCTTVPYPFLYAAVGKEQLKVYEDLEDVRRSANPFFRRKVRASSLGEMAVKELKQKYSVTFDELEKIIQEEKEEKEIDVNQLKGVAQRTKQHKVTKQLKKLKLAKSNADIQAALKGVPKISLEKLDKFAKRMAKNYERDRKFAKRVIFNSTRLSEPSADKISRLMAFGTAISEKNDIKANVTEFVNGVRASGFNLKKEAMNDKKIAWQNIAIVFMVLSIMLTTSPLSVAASGIKALIDAFMAWFATVALSWKIAIIIVFALIILLWLSQDS
jgi:hypothetical protein